MFASHPASALDLGQKAKFTGLAVAPYDPNWQFSCEIGVEGEGQEMSVNSGTDGTVAFVRPDTFDIPDIGKLVVWRYAAYGGGILLAFRDATSSADGGSDAGLGAFSDECAFILGQGVEHVQHPGSGIGFRVNAVGDRAGLDPLVLERVDGIENIEQRPAEQVDAPPHDSVTALGVAPVLLHAGPAFGFFTSGGHIGVDDPGQDTRSAERVALEPAALASGADPGVTDKCHDRSSPPPKPPTDVPETTSTMRRLVKT